MFAIRAMMMFESRTEIEDQVRDLKLSLMAVSPAELAPELFPEYFRTTPESEDVTELPEDAEFTVVNSIKDEDVDEYLSMMGVKRR